MATKKDTPNLIFRKEWWDFLRWESDETVGKAVKLLCEDYFGYEPFNIEKFNTANLPLTHERLAIPMIKSALEDKKEYVTRCEKNTANILKRYDGIRTNTNVNDEIQTNADASNCIQTNTNRIERNRIENKNNKIIFFSARTCAGEETSPEKEKKELLLYLSIYFLSKAVLKPYTTAEAAYNYNESQGWKTTNKNGTTKDHSNNKLAYLKGWQCEGLMYSLDDAALFIDFCSKFDLLMPELIDNFHGLRIDSGVFWLFDSTAAVRKFNSHFRDGDPKRLEDAVAYLREHYPQSTKGFLAKLYN